MFRRPRPQPDEHHEHDDALTAPAAKRFVGLGRKMLLAFSTVGVVIAIVGTTGLVAVQALHESPEALAEGPITRLHDIGQLDVALAELQRGITRLPALAEDRAALAEQEESFAALDASIARAVDGLSAAERQDVRSAASDLGAAITDLVTMRDQELLPLVRTGNHAGAETLLGQRADDLARQLVSAQTLMVDAEHAEAIAVADAGHVTFERARLALIATTLLGVLVAILLAGFMSRRVTRRLRRLITATEEIAEGRLDHRADVQSRDELELMAVAFNAMAERLQTSKDMEEQARSEGQRIIEDEFGSFARRVAAGDLTARVVPGDHEMSGLALNMNQMVNGLGKMSGEVREATEEMASATSQILSVVSRHNAASSEQAASIAQTSVTVNQVRETSRQASERAKALADQATAAAAAALDGRSAIDGVVGGMGAIRAKVNEITTDILALSERTQAIHDITQTVSEIADQSNMLALNATIEAARAGEHGKGFAVVANEVRALAEESKAATTQVRAILGEIQLATEKAVRAAEEGGRVVEQGTAGATAAGVAIERIGETIQETALVASQIAMSANEQSIGMERIEEAMADVATSTQEIASGADQTHAAARSLTALAARLDQLTSRYVLAAESRSTASPR